MVAYPTAIEKARIAKTLQWSASVNHSIGDQAVGAWTFDNIQGTTVIDDSGNGNDGTAFGSPAVVDGVVGNALSFDGVDDYVSVGSLANWNPDVGEHTITAWFKPTAIGASKRIFSDNCTELGFSLESDGRACAWTYSGICAPAVKVSLNNWHFAVLTYSIDTRQTKFYFDSVLQGTITFIIGNGMMDAPFNIGRDASFSVCGSSASFAGIIDDVRIFSSAFTQAQVQQLYAEGLPGHQSTLAQK